MERTWTKDFYQETDPAKRQQILKEHIEEEEAWEEEYRDRLWTARYGQRRLQKDEFVKCLMELKYLAEGTSLDLGGDRRKMGNLFRSAEEAEDLPLWYSAWDNCPKKESRKKSPNRSV